MGLGTLAGHGSGGNGTNGCLGVNLAYTKFLFVVSRDDDDAHGARLRSAGNNIARGFFNDFDIDDNREAPVQPFETIQFFVRNADAPVSAPPLLGPRIDRARHLAQVCSKYRPRLQEIEEELRRRLGDSAEVIALAGAVRNPHYTSAEMAQYSTRHAPLRRSGRVAPNAIIVPIKKTGEWWKMTPLERHAFFYPHVDRESGRRVKGHAEAAERGITTLFRRMYHNPDGYERPGEFDFLTYFECEDEHLPVFDEIMTNLRDPDQNPEWKYVQEGAIWRGRRALRW